MNGNELIRMAAKMLHDNVRTYIEIFGMDGVDDYPDWEKTPPVMRAMSVASISRMFRFFKDGKLSPELNHQLWCAYACQTGWVYGDKWNPASKTNPRIRPFPTLTHEQKQVSDIAVSVFRLFQPELIKLVYKKPETNGNGGVINMFNGNVRTIVQTDYK